MKRLLPLIIGLYILASYFRLGGVFIVLVIFAGVVWLVRMSKAAAKSQDPANLPQWQQLIQKGLQEIRREFKQRSAQQPQPQQTGWEQFKDVDQDSEPDLPVGSEPAGMEAATEARLRVTTEKKTGADASLITKKLKKQTQASDDRRKTETPLPVPQASTVATHPAMDLEQAVIWSEIISPPLALRRGGE